MICVLSGGPHKHEHYVCDEGTPRRVHIQTKDTKVSIYELKEFDHSQENHAIYEYEGTIPRKRIDGYWQFYKPF